MKWILGYLAGTRNYAIPFNINSASRKLVRYVDVDYAGDLDNRISVTGFVLHFSGRLSVGNQYYRISLLYLLQRQNIWQ